MKGNNVFEICIITQSSVEIGRKIKSAMSEIIKRRIIPKISGTPNTKFLFAFNSLELILIMHVRSVYFELFNRIIYIYIDLMILVY